MSEIDRREEWMGLGILLTELRMKTWIENRSDSKVGLYNVRSGLTDQSGWHMLQWVMDNPIPKSWDEFLIWVESYDNECEMVDGLYK